MSGPLGPATVTAVLQARITTLLARAGLTGFTTRTTHPAKADDPGVYLYLYQAVPSPFVGNDSLPLRNTDGGFVQRPRLPLGV